MTVMTSKQLVDKAKDIAKNYKTLYVMGCFGSPLNAKNKERFVSNHEYNKRPERTKLIKAATASTFGFDCVNLIKGILWGWNGNKNATYGGAIYGSNGVPDVNADCMLKYCTDVSTNFSKIEVGEILHMSGHVGVYIGDGLAVECTPIWKDGVQITAVGNIGKKTGYNTRTWTNHGKLQFVEYVKETKPVKKDDSLSKYTNEQLAEKVIKGDFGNGADRKKALGDRYDAVQKIVEKKLANKMTYHIVVKGDTLSSIAKKYKTTVADIMSLNKIKNANVIVIGQKIRVK